MIEARNHSALWARLDQFELDDSSAAYPYSKRLARENGWSAPFTERVLTEYKRFLFLSQKVDHPVVPSDAVDQAWHLHLCYTRSYWEELCGEVLRTPLHHGPTRGESTATARFGDWYEGTLAAYRDYFGHEAPPDIWPPAWERFRLQLPRRVDLSTHVVFRKRTAMITLLGGTIALLLTSCSHSDGDPGFWMLTLAILATISFLCRGGTKGGGSTGCDSGCSGCGGD